MSDTADVTIRLRCGRRWRPGYKCCTAPDPRDTENATLRTGLTRAGERARIAEAKAEARFDCHGGSGMMEPFCGGCASCLNRALDAAEAAAAALRAAVEAAPHPVKCASHNSATTEQGPSLLLNREVLGRIAWEAAPPPRGMIAWEELSEARREGWRRIAEAVARALFPSAAGPSLLDLAREVLAPTTDDLDDIARIVVAIQAQGGDHSGFMRLLNQRADLARALLSSPAPMDAEALSLELEGISDELRPRKGEGLRDAVIRLQRDSAADLARVSAERDAARAQATSAERGRAEAERRLEKQRHELETAHRWLDAHLSREAPPEAKAPKAGVTQWRGRIEDDNGDGSVIARMWKISDCAEFLITLPPAVLRGQRWRPGSAVDLWEWLPDGAWCVVDAEADERNLLRVRCDMLRAEVERLSSPAVPRGLTEEERRRIGEIRSLARLAIDGTCYREDVTWLLEIIDRLTAEAPRTGTGTEEP